MLQLDSVTFDFYQGGGVTSLNGTWDYSINNGSYIPLSTSSLLPMGSKSQDLLSINLSANQTLNLRFTLSGAEAKRGASVISFDNFQVAAVPEPVNMALAGFGLIALGAGVGRRFYAKTRK